MKNYTRDLTGKFVLISKMYWYFGKEAIPIPNRLRDIVKSNQGHKKIDDESLKNIFIDWIKLQKGHAFIGEPALFSGKFVRYKGE
jgi:hypothetical protein